ncbi:probable serine/threonine-protein kinase At1g01540 [Cryptomeria japonica]|uniref:probable serine/threonine-protein kinase At1g01540 n=1 Tax=Cryptomeria japonica TaxID=3369 RepID=UPI0025AD123E|nr:probable serine/threonine-protein kinase At1g01540 [Cryptomeria japonica]
MNGISKTIVFLAVLVSDLFPTSTWAETTKLLNCSTSSAINCDSFIYLRNVDEPINSVASRLKISARSIKPSNASDYLAKIPCSCSSTLGNGEFSYRVNYRVQPSDVGFTLGSISDKYFSQTAWTDNQSRILNVGDKVELALGCGCPIPGWHSIISYPVANGGAILLLLLLINIFYYGCRKRGSSLTQPSPCIDNGEDEYWGEESNQEQQLEKGVSALTNLTFEEIIQMKGYCEQCYKTGEGSFGKVYKGNLKDKDVAIKKIGHTGKDSKRLVENEVRLLHGKEHKNLANLIAWCIEKNTFYLVYEYVNGCTLDEYLRENSSILSLSWRHCLGVIASIAEGIEFLHLNKIILVDIKPQNLMLDIGANEAKIIDFGFSRHVDWHGTHKSTERITGSRGYWAPEYCLSHKLSYKHDVYSFGIVVLEVITGQRHVDDARGSSQFHITDYLCYMIANNRFEEALDERLKGDFWSESDLMNALAVAKLALQCAEKDKEERPDMDYVMRELCLIREESIGKESSEMIHYSKAMYWN